MRELISRDSPRGPAAIWGHIEPSGTKITTVQREPSPDWIAANRQPRSNPGSKFTIESLLSLARSLATSTDGLIQPTRGNIIEPKTPALIDEKRLRVGVRWPAAAAARARPEQCAARRSVAEKPANTGGGGRGTKGGRRPKDPCNWASLKLWSTPPTSNRRVGPRASDANYADVAAPPCLITVVVIPARARTRARIANARAASSLGGLGAVRGGGFVRFCPSLRDLKTTRIRLAGREFAVTACRVLELIAAPWSAREISAGILAN